MGPVGPAGAAGITGAVGPQGPGGLTGIEVITYNGNDVTCPSGKTAIAGGGSVTGVNGEAFMQDSFPTGSPVPTGWHVNGRATIANGGYVHSVAYVICAVVGG
jgi:hypothetical protein